MGGVTERTLRQNRRQGVVAQHIPVYGLTIGMCVVGVDRLCLPHASLRLPPYIGNLQDITILKAHDVC